MQLHVSTMAVFIVASCSQLANYIMRSGYKENPPHACMAFYSKPLAIVHASY